MHTITATIFLIIVGIATHGISNAQPFPQQLDLKSYQQIIRNLKHSSLTAAPASIDDINYYVYTRANPQNGQFAKADVESLMRNVYNPLLPTTIVIPRRNDLVNCPENAILVAGKLNVEDCNVVVVDYSRATNGDYAAAVAAAPKAGAAITEFIAVLHVHFDVQFSQIQLVGYDLGAQIAGFVGQHVQQRWDTKLSHIIGLDPAGPIFSDFSSNDERLSHDDAEFVEVIHTNAGVLGYRAPCGSVDYYPNGGTMQPGCTSLDSQCSHERAYQLAPEMWLKDNEFVSAKCNSIDNLSPHACNWLELKMGQSQAHGIYYLETNNVYPYGQGGFVTFL